MPDRLRFRSFTRLALPLPALPPDAMIRRSGDRNLHRATEKNQQGEKRIALLIAFQNFFLKTATHFSLSEGLPFVLDLSSIGSCHRKEDWIDAQIAHEG